MVVFCRRGLLQRIGVASWAAAASALALDPKFYLDPFRVRAELRMNRERDAIQPAAAARGSSAQGDELLLVHKHQALQPAASGSKASTSSGSGGSAGSGPPAQLLLDTVTCRRFGEAIEALACSLATQITGYAEGCECQLGSEGDCPDYAKGDLAPWKDFFTAQSADAPHLGVRMCMYWKTVGVGGKAVVSKTVAEQKQVTLRNAQYLLDRAGEYARSDSNGLWQGWLRR
eukprot:g3912.t1